MRQTIARHARAPTLSSLSLLATGLDRQHLDPQLKRGPARHFPQAAVAVATFGRDEERALVARAHAEHRRGQRGRRLGPAHARKEAAGRLGDGGAGEGGDGAADRKVQRFGDRPVPPSSRAARDDATSMPR